jgi:hypothetical protein
VNLRFSLRVAIRSWQDRLEPLFSIANPAPGPSADAWPGLIQLSREAIAKVRPGIGVFALQKEGHLRRPQSPSRPHGHPRGPQTLTPQHDASQPTPTPFVTCPNSPRGR